MAGLARLINTAQRLLCSHEWCHRRANDRWWLECLRCRATSPGVHVEPLVRFSRRANPVTRVKSTRRWIRWVPETSPQPIASSQR